MKETAAQERQIDEGEAITLKCAATVAAKKPKGGLKPSGTVSFSVSPSGPSQPASCTLPSGGPDKCTTTVSTSTRGAYSLIASYSGDTNFAASSGTTSLKVTGEAWDGWSIYPSPDASGSDDYLEDVTCASTTECWAAGISQGATPYQGLIEGWNGSSWSVAQTINVSGDLTSLLGVSCATTTNCWAAGFNEEETTDGDVAQPVLLQWDGTSWSPGTSATPPDGQGALYGVTCLPGAEECWAVGSFIEQWNGTAWTVSPAPASGILEDVACASATVCWAVGLGGDNAAALESWNGSQWSAVTGATPTGSDLDGITCLPGGDCWAVGDEEDGGGPRTSSLIEHWVPGSGWSIVPFSVKNGLLRHISCVTDTQCTAVGFTATTNTEPLIASGGTQGWTVQQSKGVSKTTSSSLRGVACLQSGQCWAVGNSVNNSSMIETN